MNGGDDDVKSHLENPIPISFNLIQEVQYKY